MEINYKCIEWLCTGKNESNRIENTRESNRIKTERKIKEVQTRALMEEWKSKVTVLPEKCCLLKKKKIW